MSDTPVIPRRNNTLGFTKGKKNQLVIKISDLDPELGTVEINTQSDTPLEASSNARPTTPAEEIAMAVLWFIQDYMAEAEERDGNGMVIDMSDFGRLTDGSGITRN